MILSMTGFGYAEVAEEGRHYALEIRSLNNRYFKASIKLPDFLQSFEGEIEKLLRSRLNRGSVYYALSVRSTAAETPLKINLPLLQAYVNQLDDLKTKTQDVVIDLSGLLELPGVCDLYESAPGPREQFWALLERLSSEAVDRLIDMRQKEGHALAADLLKHTTRISELSHSIAQRAPLVVEEYQGRLRIRVQQLLADVQQDVHRDDLLREVALFAERCDISEELARLESHVSQFEQLCREGDHVGRQLEFIAQEMLREANTVGSKASDATIARSVIELKTLIDRLKEQVQNVE